MDIGLHLHFPGLMHMFARAIFHTCVLTFDLGDSLILLRTSSLQVFKILVIKEPLVLCFFFLKLKNLTILMK
jgi:hypothetical protein